MVTVTVTTLTTQFEIQQITIDKKNIALYRYMDLFIFIYLSFKIVLKDGHTWTGHTATL